MTEKTIDITVEEIAQLIEEATDGRRLHLKWGSGQLVVSKENAWALVRLKEMRNE